MAPVVGTTVYSAIFVVETLIMETFEWNCKVIHETHYNKYSILFLQLWCSIINVCKKEV